MLRIKNLFITTTLKHLDATKKERADLSKAYNKAVEAEDRLASMLVKQQQQRLRLSQQFKQSAPRARGRLLHIVIGQDYD